MAAPQAQQERKTFFKNQTFLFGWLPLLTGLLLLASLPIIQSSSWLMFVIAATVCLFIYYLIATISWAVKKRWGMMALSFVSALLLAVPVVVIFLGALAMYSMFGPSEDGFADNLSLPTDVELAEPVGMEHSSHFAADKEHQTDPFQDALMTSLLTASHGDSSLTANVSSLEFLASNHPDLLLRYLAARPEWRVFREKGTQYATRRWKIRGKWHYELHGYYTDFDLGHDVAPERFQSRCTIGLEGKPWARANAKTSRLKNGETKDLALSKGNETDESHCVITTGPVVLEIFEQSIGKERRLTKAAIRQLESEFVRLAETPTEETLFSLVPKEETRSGEADLLLIESFQGGIYDGEVWCNPGESGTIYLQAYEITTGARLSAFRLQEKSSERVNWSEDPSELFMAKTHFTIYEGDWEQYYGARFEVWFIPDSGEPEKKLFEKNYKIEGWMR